MKKMERTGNTCEGHPGVPTMMVFNSRGAVTDERKAWWSPWL